MTAPWWTPADQAELDVLVNDLVRCYWAHRDECADCRERRPCPSLTEAIEAVIEFRDARELRSRAVWLRSEQSRLEVAS